MRSYLLVAARDDDALAAALSCGADALVLDLGDEAGREAGRRFLLRARDAAPRPTLYALVAPLRSTAIDADLGAVVSAGADGVCLAEARGAASIQHLCAKLAVAEAECGRDDGATSILAMATQTPAAIFALGDYAGASRRLEALVFDTEPLRLALGAAEGAPLDPSTPFALARASALLGAAAAGVAAVDRPFLDIGDEAGLSAECRAARRDGFAGKLAIHPRQIDAIARA
jgi:citrate lyase subunit beta/citryl-CoA lyase